MENLFFPPFHYGPSQLGWIVITLALLVFFVVSGLLSYKSLKKTENQMEQVRLLYITLRTLKITIFSLLCVGLIVEIATGVDAFFMVSLPLGLLYVCTLAILGITLAGIESILKTRFSILLRILVIQITSAFLVTSFLWYMNYLMANAWSSSIMRVTY